MRAWIPLGEAQHQVLAAGERSGAYLELLGMLATPRTTKGRDNPRPFIQCAVQVECCHLLRKREPLPGMALPSWQRVVMPMDGWRALMLLRGDISTMTATLERAIQERFSTDAGGRAVHLLHMEHTSSSGRYSYRTGRTRTQYELRTVCRAAGSKLLLASSGGVTCVECLATEVEQALGGP